MNPAHLVIALTARLTFAGERSGEHMANSPKRTSSADLLKKCADKLQQFQKNEIIADNRQMCEVWEMLRVLTLRIRDLEADSEPRAIARKINRIGRSPDPIPITRDDGDSGGAA